MTRRRDPVDVIDLLKKEMISRQASNELMSTKDAYSFDDPLRIERDNRAKALQLIGEALGSTKLSSSGRVCRFFEGTVKAFRWYRHEVATHHERPRPAVQKRELRELGKAARSLAARIDGLTPATRVLLQYNGRTHTTRLRDQLLILGDAAAGEAALLGRDFGRTRNPALTQLGYSLARVWTGIVPHEKGSTKAGGAAQSNEIYHGPLVTLACELCKLERVRATPFTVGKAIFEGLKVAGSRTRRVPDSRTT